MKYEFVKFIVFHFPIVEFLSNAVWTIYYYFNTLTTCNIQTLDDFDQTRFPKDVKICLFFIIEVRDVFINKHHKFYVFLCVEFSFEIMLLKFKQVRVSMVFIYILYLRFFLSRRIVKHTNYVRIRTGVFFNSFRNLSKLYMSFFFWILTKSQNVHVCPKNFMPFV